MKLKKMYITRTRKSRFIVRVKREGTRSFQVSSFFHKKNFFIGGFAPWTGQFQNLPFTFLVADLIVLPFHVKVHSHAPIRLIQLYLLARYLKVYIYYLIRKLKQVSQGIFAILWESCTSVHNRAATVDQFMCQAINIGEGQWK